MLRDLPDSTLRCKLSWSSPLDEASEVEDRCSALVDLYCQLSSSFQRKSVTYSIKKALISTASNISSGKSPCSFYTAETSPRLISLFMAALCNRGAIIFLPCDFYLLSIFLSIFFFYSSPNLSGHRLDVYHTSTHGVALVRI